MNRNEKMVSHYHMVIMFVTFLYPLWKVFAYLNLHSPEHWLYRLIPAAIGGVYLSVKNFKPEIKKYAEHMASALACLVVVEYLVLTHSFVDTPQYMYYFVGSFIITSAFVNACRSRLSFYSFMTVAPLTYIIYFTVLAQEGFTQELIHHALLAGTLFLVNGMITWRNIENENFLKQIEAEIDIHKAQLIQSSKLASLGEMAGGIAHEINNPLQIISGNVEILEIMPDNQDCLKNIKDTVGRIHKIIEGLKVFSRNSEGVSMEPTKLNDVLGETLGFCSEKFKNSGIEINTNINEGIYVKCNHVELSRVFLNLMNNAYDAIMEENTHENKFVNISAEVSQNRLVLKFADSGKKISPEIKEKIFNPFFTTKSIGKGTGIGLSLSKGIIENHQGFLDLNLDPKEFIINLPVNDL